MIVAFTVGPYKGTWVHRDLAPRLAMWCDDYGKVMDVVSEAIVAMADGRVPTLGAAVPPDDSIAQVRRCRPIACNRLLPRQN